MNASQRIGSIEFLPVSHHPVRKCLSLFWMMTRLLVLAPSSTSIRGDGGGRERERKSVENQGFVGHRCLISIVVGRVAVRVAVVDDAIRLDDDDEILIRCDTIARRSL